VRDQNALILLDWIEIEVEMEPLPLLAPRLASLRVACIATRQEIMRVCRELGEPRPRQIMV
jgi:hypothetical protein